MKYLVLIAALQVTVEAYAGKVFLGTTRLFKDISEELDRDVIHLGGCQSGANTALKRIQIRVRHNDIHLKKIVAVFGNGQRQRFQVRKNFSAGSESRWIDLKGNKRCIRKLKLVGNTVTDNIIDAIFGPTAEVRVWGYRGSTGGTKKLVSIPVKYGQANNYKPHGRNLGCKLARKVRVVAKQGRMKVKNFRVHFRNGGSQLIPLRSRFFKAGQRSNWKDLKGGTRCIKRVTFRGFSPNGAKLNLLGK